MLILGIAIGYSLNLETARVFFGRPVESRMAGQPTYLIEPPDILRVRTRATEGDPWTSEEHLVGPDGRVNVSADSPVDVAGMTIEQARDAIAASLGRGGTDVWVDVISYNSKVCYVIQRTALGDSVTRLPITGNETVMDALAHTGVEVGVAERRLSIRRPSEDGVGRAQVLPVRWDADAGGVTPTANYQLFPGDRVIIERLGAP